MKECFFIRLRLFFCGECGTFGKISARPVVQNNLFLMIWFGSLTVLPFNVIRYGCFFRFSFHEADYIYALIAGIVGVFGWFLFCSEIETGAVLYVVAMMLKNPKSFFLLSEFPFSPINTRKIDFDLKGLP